jgi:hypothetical protein
MRWSNWLDASIAQRLRREPPTGALHATTGRAGPVTDRTRSSSLSSAQRNSDRTRCRTDRMPQYQRPVGVQYAPWMTGRVWSKNWNTRRRWTLTGHVWSSVRSPLWPPFAFVSFLTSGGVENSRFNSSKTPESRLASSTGEREDPNPLYRSNSNAIAKVLTPPSDHVMCKCVSIFTIIFQGVISSIQIHMIMKCTLRGT